MNKPWHLFFAEAVELLLLVNAYRVHAGNFLADTFASGRRSCYLLCVRQQQRFNGL